MIERLAEPSASACVLAVKISDKLRGDDVVELQEWIDSTHAKEGACRLLVEFGDFRGWDVEGLAGDLKFHLIGSKEVARIAYVGDKRWERAMVNISRAVTATGIRYFEKSAIDAAYEWLADH
jgi:hypothetical protein